MYMTIDNLGIYLLFMLLVAAALSWISVRALNKIWNFTMKVDIVMFIVLWMMYSSAIVYVAIGR